MFSRIKDILEKRRTRELFNKPPKNAGEEELVDFYNNEIIRIAKERIIDEKIAQYLISLNISTDKIKQKPIICNARIPTKHGTRPLMHTLFIVGLPNEKLQTLSQPEIEDWTNECMSVFGFPLASFHDQKSMNVLCDDIMEIVRYNDPMLVSNARSYVDLVRKSGDIYEKVVQIHFNRDRQEGISLLLQFTDYLSLSYNFEADVSIEILRQALVKSRKIIDSFFEWSVYEEIPEFPIARRELARYMRDPNARPYDPEIFEISEEIKEYIKKFKLDLAPNEKVVMMLKIAQDLIEFQTDEDKYIPTLDRLSEMIKYFDTSFKTSKLVIDADNKILLPEYELEIQMQPIHKAVYILFYRHPEGILLTDLDKHREELTAIYTAVSNRRDPEVLEKTIIELLNPASNSINECMSRIREAFLKVLDERIAKLYYVSGERGGVKRIEGVKLLTRV